MGYRLNFDKRKGQGSEWEFLVWRILMDCMYILERWIW